MRTRFPAEEISVGESSGGLLSVTKMSENARASSGLAGTVSGGTVVVEKLFALPGAGALMVESIFARDYPVIQALALVFAFVVILINLFTDLIYASLDPRITLL